MKKLKLLFALCALLGGAISASAQTDVTSTYLTNANFEGNFSVFSNPSADRAIYQPTGWTVTYSGGEGNDMTALNSSCLAWSNFSSKPQLATGGNNTYWIRFRWGSSESLTLSQTVTLPVGVYCLSADAFFNGADGGTAKISANGNEKSITGNSTWGNYKVYFVITSEKSVTFSLNVTQTKQAENIAAFDNFTLTRNDIIDAGWTLVTDISSMTLSDYYFMFLDGQEGKYTMTNGMPKGLLTGVRRPVFQEMADPTSAIGQVWIIENYDESNYAVKSIADNYYLNSNGQWWSSHVSSDYGETSRMQLLSIAVGKYRLQTTGTSTYWGPYNDSPTVALGNASGMDYAEGASDSHYAALAANKGEANAPGFYIYSIARTTYDASCHRASTLVSDGWTQATAESDLGKPGYYYAFLDASENGGESGFVMTGTGGRPQYKLGKDPIVDKTQLWTTEAHGSGYAIKNVSDNKYIYAAANWNMQATDDISTANTDFIPTVNEGVWTISNSISTSEFLGNYKNSPFNPTDGEGLAANKASEKGKRTFLIFSIPTIAGVAAELPANGDMVADTWYYIDIAAAADNYTATATDLSKIVYSADASTTVVPQITTNTFTAENNSLAAQRYYVKSSIDNNLEIGVPSYTYSVSSATADRSYIQPSQTVTVSYTVSTNDPGATLDQDYSGVTFDGKAIDIVPGDNGFTFTAPANLAVGTEYTLAIPAGSIGYDEGSTYNEAQEITLTTPAAYDGFYFLRSGSKYVSRGANYNSRAIMDEFGLPLSVATSSTGITQFTYVDNGKKLFLDGDGNAYTDNTSDADWTTENTTGGFYIVHANGTYDGKKLNIYEGSALYATTTEGAVFEFEPVSEHNTYMEALKDAQAATAATAIGQGAITTKSGLASWLESNYNAEPVTIAAVGFTDKWNGNASAEWGAGKDMYTATVNDLPEGLYKLTVNGYYRLNGSATAAEGARGNVYLYGGSVKTQLYSIHDFPAAEAYSKSQSDAYGYYPDDATSGEAATTGDNYLTELYVYHNGGNFTYGIHQPSRFSNAQWFGFQNFTLTYYYPDNVSATIGATGWTTFASKFALDLSKLPDGVAAYYAATDAVGDGVITVTAKSDEAVAAGTGLLLKGTAGESYDIPVVASGTDITASNMLVGCTSEVTLSNSTENYANIYVLGIKSGTTDVAEFQNVKNYIDNAGGDPRTVVIPAGKAYLNATASNSGRGLRIVIGGDITGIDEAKASIEAVQKDGKFFKNGKLFIFKNGKKYNATGAQIK